MFLACLSGCLSSANISSHNGQAVLVVGQHTVHAPPWTHLQSGEFISMQKWNTLQGGLVHYTDADVGASDD